jgi:hypothetical protein
VGPLRATETGSVMTFRRVVRGTKPTGGATEKSPTSRLQEMLAVEGFSEKEIIKDFKRK